ncbi:hypothetical protein BSKO_01272 [Bryopsis sp. KO-2023]|nr:hypothetical protein BSKO_01272 [Bryopsis sp. KO-2023]
MATVQPGMSRFSRQVALTGVTLPATARPETARRTPTVVAAARDPQESAACVNRRALLATVAVAPLVTRVPTADAGVFDFLEGSKEVDYSAVKADIKELIKADADKGPTLVRLAWHSSGTYDKMSKSGGSSKGTIRFREELAHGANAGLNKATSWMEPIHAKYADQGLSYADLYTFGGVVAVEALGGPTIGWRSGRVDAMDPSEIPPEGRLPAADKGSPEATAQHMRDVFYRMGFNDREIVALAGAHTLGRGHADASGYDGAWTPAPTTFSNLYYTLLLNLTWEGEKLESGVFQYTDSATKKLMMLPADLVMIEDPEFKKYVQLYAEDRKQFFSDFATAFQKLEELGCSDLKDVSFA